MHRGLLVGALVTSSAAVLMFCSGDNRTTSDASTDGTLADAGPSQGFTISLQDSHITADPDDTVGNTINLQRAPSFSDTVGFTITNLPAEVMVTVAPPDIPGMSLFTSSEFDLIVGNATPGDYVITVTGQSKPSGAFTASATFGLHIGSLLQPGDAGYVVPSFATSVIMKAWGAGGGGGSGYTMCAGLGAPGGGGGFAGGVFPVTPLSTLVPIVGSGGEGGGRCATNGWWGGGGGGFTALQLQGASDYMLVAGGGGGGAAAMLIGFGGGAGGGLAGGSGYGNCVGFGGSQDAGGVALDAGCASVGNNGSTYQGGAGFSNGCTTNAAAGGEPGGGGGGVVAVANCAGQGGGGGGGGYYGGAGGGPGGSGGGGSGWLPPDAGGQLVAGDHSTPANTTDSDYVLCPVNTGVGGDGGVADGSAGSPGGNGCVIVRLTKP